MVVLQELRYGTSLLLASGLLKHRRFQLLLLRIQGSVIQSLNDALDILTRRRRVYISRLETLTVGVATAASSYFLTKQLGGEGLRFSPCRAIIAVCQMASILTRSRRDSRQALNASLVRRDAAHILRLVHRVVSNAGQVSGAMQVYPGGRVLVLVHARIVPIMNHRVDLEAGSAGSPAIDSILHFLEE